MLHLTMKAHLRRSHKPVLILGCDADRAVTIDEDGNLSSYRLRSLKVPALEAQLRMEMDTKGIHGLLEAVMDTDDEIGFEISK